MSLLILSQDEIREIAGRKQRPAQARVLKAIGIRHRIRPDGTILVFRADLGLSDNGDVRARFGSAVGPNRDAFKKKADVK